MKKQSHRFAQALQWLGWDRSPPSTAAVFADDAVWMLALRDRPLRVTACGSAPLLAGTVRNGELRLVGLGADGLRTVREFLRIPAESPLAIVVDPQDVEVAPERDSILARVDSAQIESLSRGAEEALAASVRLDPAPASIARLARLTHLSEGAPIYAGGAGWLSVSVDGRISEVVATAASTDSISTGVSPSSLLSMPRPSAVQIASGVELDGPWQLLLGAALAAFGEGPTAVIERGKRSSGIGWSAERVSGAAR